MTHIVLLLQEDYSEEGLQPFQPFSLTFYIYYNKNFYFLQLVGYFASLLLVCHLMPHIIILRWVTIGVHNSRYFYVTEHNLNCKMPVVVYLTNPC